MKHLLFGMVILTAVSGCQQLELIPHEPAITPAEWCAYQPCLEIGTVIISQPSSSLIVYFLALLSIAVAIYFLRTVRKQQSRFWWGISLFLGGIGALLAGTSYQAFGYEIKCAGRDFCVWTSWWEIGYELLTVAGAGALLVAVGYSSFSRKWQKACCTYAMVNTVVYSLILLQGVTTPDKFLVSFEFMLLFTAPAYVLILFISIGQYFHNRAPVLKAYIGAWLLLFATLGAYYWYMVSGFTQSLFASGIWFSENDVLHVGMISWIVYVYLVLGKVVNDVNFGGH